MIKIDLLKGGIYMSALYSNACSKARNFMVEEISIEVL